MICLRKLIGRRIGGLSADSRRAPGADSHLCHALALYVIAPYQGLRICYSVNVTKMTKKTGEVGCERRNAYRR